VSIINSDFTIDTKAVTGNIPAKTLIIQFHRAANDL
jgi:hypothetical protein